MVGVVVGGGLLGGRTAQRPAGEGGRGNGKDEHDGPHPDEAPVRVQGALAVLARVHTGDKEKEERHENEEPAARTDMMHITMVATNRHLFPLRVPPMQCSCPRYPRRGQ